ncbi:type II secretion system protein [Chitinispirillales bacterium ANBcel5]|uniref:pilus assembly FimT family protein n=1 Tax=Cellulosispirillum alkaliphilum TaxID=3039283 RepID=UPI002A55BA36|nr:type II secretion system protein [Chitinispirillales bacterium ANBcel5]
MNWVRRSLSTKKTSGFTLIEVLIAIVVVGIIAAIVTVNWASFLRYQNLRRESVSVWRELSSLKARALNEDVEFVVSFPAHNHYDIDTSGVTISQRSLTDGIHFSQNPTVGGVAAIDPPQDSWTDDDLTVRPDNIEAFTTGKIYLHDNNRVFCIVKREDRTTLQLFYWDGDEWEEM